MMQLTFENPVNLWFLLALPLLFIAHFFFLHLSKRRALRFANFRAIKRVAGRGIMTRNHLLLALRLATLAFVIFAVSGATVWFEGPSSQNDYVLLIDASASMTAEDIWPTRIGAAKEHAKQFVEELEAEARIGVIGFSGVALIQTVPTEERERVLEAIEAIEPHEVGGTDIPGAIITSANLLIDNTKGRSIILLTDGSSTVESFIDDSMQHALDYALGQRITIHAIGIGTDSGPIGYLPTYYNISSVYNEENLFQIANATGGTYAHVEDADQLADAFATIRSESDIQLLRRDLRPLMMLFALILLLVEWVLINTRFRRIP